ncbi:MAG: ribosomal protein [Candidatus Kaiserbacteria bacterium]|nr:ribosomal protein [Candidatus Kaiserbacteria bacterium]
MSRIGKKPLPIPSGVEVSVLDGAVTIKGKAGSLTRPLHPTIDVTVENNNLTVSMTKHSRLARALWGTYASHMQNMLAGVVTPFVKKLELQGIGYKVELVGGKQIKLIVGFSHPVIMDIPADLSATVEKNIISIIGIDKDAVGHFAAKVRAVKKPEPYKGKGIRYEGEVVRMKEGKKAGA